ncbi:MAG: hypothetical protein RIB84_23070 [Sneathiellaceae bacterium]
MAGSSGRWPVWKLAVAAAIAMTLLVPLLLGLFLAYAVLGLFLVAGLYGAVAAFRQARLFADTPKSTIRAAAQGHVELVARGAATDLGGQAIRGPLSDSPGCTWTLEAQRRVRSGKSSRWQTEGEARAAPWLPVSDGTGTCLVAIAEAVIHSRRRCVREADAELRQAVAAHFDPPVRKAMARGGRWRLREVLLPADAELYAMGLFESRPIGTADDAGVSGAWQAAVRRDAVPPGIALANLLLPDRRAGQGLPLIVSDRPERWLVRRYRLYTLGCGLLAIGAGAILLLLLARQHPELLGPLLFSLGLPMP